MKCMNDKVLIPGGDPMGAAIYDFHKNGTADVLRVFSSQFEEDEIPVADLFREYDDMPELERIALDEASGEILDVGAGSGCHSVALMKMGKSAVAIDISPLSVEVMKERGVDALQVNLYDESFDRKFDTVLMLMNGTGIIGNLDNMPVFFERMKQLLKPGGSILIDSSDLRYLFEEEDGSFMIRLFCVDPATNLKECMRKALSTVLFSATFLPIQYYKKLLGGESEDYEVYAHSVFSLYSSSVFKSSVFILPLQKIFARTCFGNTDFFGCNALFP